MYYTGGRGHLQKAKFVVNVKLIKFWVLICFAYFVLITVQRENASFAYLREQE